MAARWIRRCAAASVVLGAISLAFPAAPAPLLLLVLGGFLAVQRGIDRVDPRLGGGAAWPERDLRFG